MKLSKRILKNRHVQGFLCWIAHLYIWFVYFTGRWDVRGGEYFKELEDAGKPFIIAFWHGRLLMIPPFGSGRSKTHVLISNHNDGELIARTMTHFNFDLIRGSTNKDGVAALKQILRTLKKGEVVAITPDGPKGPRMRIGGAIIKIAQMTAVPVIPMTFAIDKCKVLRSWDSFMMAKPFGKGVFIYGKPFTVNRKSSDDELEKAGIELEKQLNNITRQADEAVGVDPIMPA